ncbi:PREDICTED: uncharacterized protein LOC109164808 [Ipomoea nil]|uniref:uncharacterized protein LOC109164808 n=1 Tax=Ipomoea nil TaxID=35883 RepID=UPI000900D9D3|nr:PREDICTED: uncharacterized protein LOC109164808 [Ipomoea nil]
MSDSDSQNVSVADYDNTLEQSSEEVDIMSYSPEVGQRPPPAPERAPEPEESTSSSETSGSSSSRSGNEETSTSGRNSPAEDVRGTPLRVIGDYPQVEPEEEHQANEAEAVEGSPAEPAAPRGDGYEFLNSESVEGHKSLLTNGEASRIAAVLAAMAGFGDEDVPMRPVAKISLGKKKGQAKPAGEKEIPVVRPIGASTITTTEGFVVDASEVLVSRVAVGKGKEKVAEKTTAETGALKRRREQHSPTPSGGGSRGGSSILARIGNVGSAKEDFSKLTPSQVAEKIGYDLAEISRATQFLQQRALQANEAEGLKKVANQRLQEIRELEAQLKKAKAERDLSEQVAQQAIGEAAELKARQNDPDKLAQYLFQDAKSGDRFLQSVRGTEVGEKLIWTFGRWAYKAGQRKMRDQTRKIMEQALEGDDLQLVLTTLPDEVPDPGPAPFDPKERTKVSGADAAPGGEDLPKKADAESSKK